MKRVFLSSGSSFPLLRRRVIAIPLALLCVCALCFATNLPSYVTANTAQRQLPIYCVQRDYKVCSLSFDAAWGNVSLRSPSCAGDRQSV